MNSNRQKLVFQTLQPIFSKLLDHALPTQRLAELFKDAALLMQRDIMLREHMHLCLDYLLFPYQFILPSIAAARRPEGKAAALGGSGAAGTSIPALASPLAAEHALHCLQILVELAQLRTVQQVTGLAALLVELIHLQPSPQTNEQMVLCAVRTVRSICTASCTHVCDAFAQNEEWHVTAGYLVHGLLAVASREAQGAGFGALCL